MVGSPSLLGDIQKLLGQGRGHPSLGVPSSEEVGPDRF